MNRERAELKAAIESLEKRVARNPVRGLRVWRWTIQRRKSGEMVAIRAECARTCAPKNGVDK
jgi:hypothetical protein